MGGEDDLGRIVMVSSQATGVGFYWYQKVSGLVGEYRECRCFITGAIYPKYSSGGRGAGDATGPEHGHRRQPTDGASADADADGGT